MVKSQRGLPKWTESQEKWEKVKKEIAEGGIKYGRNPQTYKPYTECSECGKKIILTLCKYRFEKYYCPEHCPKHKWQSDYDWQTECGRCGITYIAYLQGLLQKYDIPFERRLT